MRKASNEGGDSRDTRPGAAPPGTRLFHMYKGAKRFNGEREKKNDEGGEAGATQIHRCDGTRASGCHPSLHVVLDFWPRFSRVVLWPPTRSYTPPFEKSVPMRRARLLCQLPIERTTG